MEYHEIANIFPMMAGAEYEQLLADIMENGQLDPVVLYEGKILDGRNRWKACMELGLVINYEQYPGDNPLSYVISKNLHRRHLNETQRGVIGARIANMQLGDNQYKTGSANLQTHVSQSEAARQLNVSPRMIATVKEVERKAPELITHMESGKMTAHEAIKKIKETERNAERAELAQSAQNLPADDRWSVEQGDINDYQTNKQFDFIITDPPYPKEYLELYEVLARRANDWLKPGGLLIAMCGQSYLNQIYEMMSKHLDYYWTAAYLTPGESASLWQKNVIPKWKPLLIFAKGKYSGKMFGDVYSSGANEKSLHKWGQSESGMYSIVSGVCLPGQSIFDPFCGAGTTGVAALRHGCLFHGIDIDLQNVNISKGRLHDS